jgi:putative lipoprotein
MKKPFFLVPAVAWAAVLTAAACTPAAPDRVVTADRITPPPVHEAVFACGRDIAHTRFQAETLNLRLGDEDFLLNQVRSGSGARFEGQSDNRPVLFWNKGREAILEIGGRSYPTCRQIDSPGGASVAADAVQDAEWVVEDISGRGVVDRSRVTMSFAPDGQLSGKAGCNGYGAGYEITGDKLKVGPIRATRMACAPALMTQEAAFLDVLGSAGGFRIRPDGALVLSDMSGRTILARREGK